jgi:hypothetical protein
MSLPTPGSMAAARLDTAIAIKRQTYFRRSFSILTFSTVWNLVERRK